MATKYDPLSYGEVLRLTEGHGTSEIYDRIQHALAARPVAALARVLISRADAKRFVERWAGGPVHELTDGTAPAGTLGDLVARLAVRQSPSPSGDADARAVVELRATLGRAVLMSEGKGKHVHVPSELWNELVRQIVDLTRPPAPTTPPAGEAVSMHDYARREVAELDREDTAMYLWLYRRCDDGHLTMRTDMWFWWMVYCDLSEWRPR